jgi:CHAT domain-containing protein
MIAAIRSGHRDPARWVTAIATACAIGIMALAHLARSPRPESVSPVRRIVDSAPSSSRRIEARIADCRWAPFRTSRKAGPSADTVDDLRLFGVAGTILAESRNARSPELLHAAGIASLIVGRTGDAIARLEEAVRRSPTEARTWSDLAAARYTEAVTDDQPEGLPAALAAADRGLELSPALCEARFNRALILTQLGIRDAAKRAWRDDLEAESDSAWRREAEGRVRSLVAGNTPQFAGPFQRALDRARVGDFVLLQALAHDRTQETRAAGEMLLSSWAEATSCGDAEWAERCLTDTRLVAGILVATNGDRLLADAVRAIEASAGDAARRGQLVAAQLTYRDGRKHYHSQLAGSDDELLQAATLFDLAHSPMANVARYYAGNAMFDRNRSDAAQETLLRVLHETDVHLYPSLVAGVEKELGLSYAFRGIWTASLRHLNRARTIFARLGETVNAAFADAIVGEVSDRIAQFGDGWRHRRASLDVLSRSSPGDRLISVLAGAVHAEIMRDDSEGALSLLKVAVDEANRVGNPVLTAETLLRRARVLLAVRGGAAASKVLGAARLSARGIVDPLTRSRIEADVGTVEGEMLERTNPAAAVDVLTRSIAFYKANGFGMLLPPAYLQRGRAALASGDQTKALSDFEEGLAEVERQRATVAADARVTVFDTAPDLIAETIDLLLARGRDEDAFAVVEQARARTLVEALGAGPVPPGTVSAGAIKASLSPHTVFIEYALLPRGLAVFCIGPGGLTVAREDAEVASLRALSLRLARTMDERESLPHVQQLLSELHQILIAPAADRISGATSLIIVPDRFLSAVPFPALFDRKRARYLVEDYRIVIAPSGGYTVRRPSRRQNEPALIVADPVNNSGSGPLPAAREEAVAIARLYDHPTLLIGRDATAERFVAEAPLSAVIHYAGHAFSDDAVGGFLPFASSSDSDGGIDASAIARLPLEHTSLVVLGACGTLRGSSDRVEGMPSIARAFLAAGVPSVIGTLWDVDDRSAGRLLRLFHQQLRATHSPSEALRAAQCALLHDRDERLRQPAIWASTELLGID